MLFKASTAKGTGQKLHKLHADKITYNKIYMYIMKTCVKQLYNRVVRYD